MRRWFMVLFAALLVSAAALAGPGSAPKAEVPAGLLAVIKQIKPATALVEVNTP